MKPTFGRRHDRNQHTKTKESAGRTQIEEGTAKRRERERKVRERLEQSRRLAERQQILASEKLSERLLRAGKVRKQLRSRGRSQSRSRSPVKVRSSIQAHQPNRNDRTAGQSLRNDMRSKRLIPNRSESLAVRPRHPVGMSRLEHLLAPEAYQDNTTEESLLRLAALRHLFALVEGKYIPRSLALPPFLVPSAEGRYGHQDTDNKIFTQPFESFESILTRGYKSGLYNGKLFLKADIDLPDFIHDAPEFELNFFRPVDVLKTLQRIPPDVTRLLKSDLIMEPVECADCIASWRWDFVDDKSQNLLKVLVTARRNNFRYVLIDCVSVDQSSADVIKVIIEYGKLYSVLPTIRSYDLLQMLGKDFKLNDFIRPWIYIEVSRGILLAKFGMLGDFPILTKFRFLIDVLNLLPKTDVLKAKGIECEIHKLGMESIVGIETGALNQDFSDVTIGTLFRQCSSHAHQWSSSAAFVCMSTKEIATKVGDLMVIRLLLEADKNMSLLQAWRASDLEWSDRLQVTMAKYLLGGSLTQMGTRNYIVPIVDFVDDSTYANATMNLDIPLKLEHEEFVGVLYEADERVQCIEIFRGLYDIVLHIVLVPRIAEDALEEVLLKLSKKDCKFSANAILTLDDDLCELADDLFYQKLCYISVNHVPVI